VPAEVIGAQCDHYSYRWKSDTGALDAYSLTVPLGLPPLEISSAFSTRSRVIPGAPYWHHIPTMRYTCARRCCVKEYQNEGPIAEGRTARGRFVVR
jgi:hypothetical protein